MEDFCDSTAIKYEWVDNRKWQTILSHRIYITRSLIKGKVYWHSVNNIHIWHNNSVPEQNNVSLQWCCKYKIGELQNIAACRDTPLHWSAFAFNIDHTNKSADKWDYILSVSWRGQTYRQPVDCLHSQTTNGHYAKFVHNLCQYPFNV